MRRRRCKKGRKRRGREVSCEHPQIALLSLFFSSLLHLLLLFSPSCVFSSPSSTAFGKLWISPKSREQENGGLIYIIKKKQHLKNRAKLDTATYQNEYLSIYICLALFAAVSDLLADAWGLFFARFL